jgi:hemolysin-activating ACP:hemolysin acyltransferase
MDQDAEGDAKPPGRPAMRLFRPESPVVALGLAVNHLMSRQAFAQLRFGDCSKILVGQINRKHYRFVLDANDQVVGFLGWAVTSRDTAEAWIENHRAFSDAEARDGDCIVFNAWSASTPDVNPSLLQAARQAVQGRDMVYFRRLYRDGTVRPVRLRVNDFVTGHLERRVHSQ